MIGTFKVIEEEMGLFFEDGFLLGGGGGGGRTSDPYTFTETTSELENRLNTTGISESTRDRFLHLIKQAEKAVSRYEIGTFERNQLETELGNKFKDILDSEKFNDQAANEVSDELHRLLQHV